MTDASESGLVETWRRSRDVERDTARRLDPGTRERELLERSADTYDSCADELEAALPDLLYAAGEHASITGLLSDAQIEGLTVYQQVETLVAARTAGGWQEMDSADKNAPALLLKAGATVLGNPPVIEIGRWIEGDPHTRGVRTESMWRYRRSNPGYDKEHQPTHWMPLPAGPKETL